MNEPQECIDVTNRFFEALEAIKGQKRMRGLNTFVRQYGLHWWNFVTCQKQRLRIKQEWLTYLVRDYDVSAKWLLTGKGKMFTKTIIPNDKYPRRSPLKKQNSDDSNKT